MKEFVANDISIYRNSNKIISNINFSLVNFSSLIIEGANGSGKTSILKSIIGIIDDYKGHYTLDGQKVSTKIIRQLSLYIGHKNYAHGYLTVQQNLLLWTNIYNTRLMLPSVIVNFDLENILDMKYNQLSEGWKRRVSLSRTLLSNKLFWILDEPFNNIDTYGCQSVINVINTRINTGGMVILTKNTDHKYDIKNSQILNIND
ncbi:MAG: ABC transporter family protein [Candidatus Xenolissoclinum pacificiensis L6]|uniref:ABC transporter family protein n=1 Tax=Candidatus Xenolissoclinum pacificiensis L6 TaxID=1401685 RepID=W2V0W1_9RICK|nr:MAG: ABC transporter family protein [Candidatus Xenolissoclinum pacificiensis L6]